MGEDNALELAFTFTPSRKVMEIEVLASVDLMFAVEVPWFKMLACTPNVPTTTLMDTPFADTGSFSVYSVMGMSISCSNTVRLNCVT